MPENEGLFPRDIAGHKTIAEDPTSNQKTTVFTTPFIGKSKPARLNQRLPLLRPRDVGIDSALDLGDAFGVAVNHAGDCDRASYDDGHDRNQKRPQAYDGIEDSIHAPPPTPSGAKALFLSIR